MEDWELFQKWSDGDRAAGETLVRRHVGVLTRFFRNKVRNPDDAAELTSETLLACTKNKDRINPTSFRSFLFAVAMNTLRNYHRKQGKRQREFDDFEEFRADVGPLAFFLDFFDLLLDKFEPVGRTFGGQLSLEVFDFFFLGFYVRLLQLDEPGQVHGLFFGTGDLTLQVLNAFVERLGQLH